MFQTACPPGFPPFPLPGPAQDARLVRRGPMVRALRGWCDWQRALWGAWIGRLRQALDDLRDRREDRWRETRRCYWLALRARRRVRSTGWEGCGWFDSSLSLTEGLWVADLATEPAAA
ncbi:hypothetical protein [Pseudaquabacterium rugosum]|jgi:hypothetical protein|uniref:Uncharacterized protein n=1 Tax=Pseudaquabacterium rugosum TaxID=2984194 RepID=A0ABU9BCV7_9BURK